jgi:hypothetical protein
MFATTVQAELNATLHVCESGLQDIRIFLGLVPKESPCIFPKLWLRGTVTWKMYCYVRTEGQKLITVELRKTGCLFIYPLRCYFCLSFFLTSSVEGYCCTR